MWKLTGDFMEELREYYEKCPKCNSNTMKVTKKLLREEKVMDDTDPEKETYRMFRRVSNMQKCLSCTYRKGSIDTEVSEPF